LENYSNRGRAGINGGYHLDHMFSVRQGFLNNVPASTIGSKHNLCFIPWQENVKKQDRCSITLSELLRRVENEKN
jgi:hypothetical protein